MSDNFFDTALSVAFDTTTTLMGYDAEWYPADGPMQTARVHYKDPSSLQKIGDMNYDPGDGIMEYKKGDFEGLIELVAQNKPEVIKITIGGTKIEFRTLKDKKLFDGKTLQVKLQRKR